MEVEITASKFFMSFVVVGIFALLWHLYVMLVANPRKIRRMLKKQGINGPKPKFLLGNILELKKMKDAVVKHSDSTEPPVLHNCGPLLLPFFDTWKHQFGDIFRIALGNTTILIVNRYDVLKEITTCTSLDFGKPSYLAKDRGAILGNGIITSNGHYWAQQRKLIAPQLYMDKVKEMCDLINGCVRTMLDAWNNIIESNGGGIVSDIEIVPHMRSFSGDVISRACFGSNFQQGEEIFSKLRELFELSSTKAFSLGIPGMRHIPTKNNRKLWALEKEIHELILGVVKQRTEVGYTKDLLQMLLEGGRNSELRKHEIDQFIVTNCKNIYLAGYETTAVSATWALMLLATNQDWQDRVRAEAIEVCKGQPPDAVAVSKMKVLTMVINESLRLYPPVVVMSREALKDIKFGDIHVPKGVNVWAVVTSLHTDPEIWGEDSYKFNPSRFANGVTGACKLPHLYMPFGVGPRICLGQNLALVELKILISLILSSYSLSLSPKYVHVPSLSLVVEPGKGMNLLVRKL
ncbi:Triterpene C-23 carboxylase [Heracleum sosnowskyi]|uniref:Triterpene C-23 carboxylase n=1 Tax=Heracleum sosnowskyi TaxID=360622 RepID=A0AAD8MK16_9APIA|nr:Triterpene C-23 carboxylase [Heracleum sosnowskyi]